MRFSIIYEAQMVDTSRENEALVFAQTVEQCLLADELGFDCIWAVEHHCLKQYAHMSAPESFLAFIAGATKRIHVGQGVVCLPFKMNHPIKVAERIAMLDILSKGRLHFGVGKGSTYQEAGAFDADLAQVTAEVDESMYMIPKMWLDEDFEHKSDLITVPRRPIYPKPYQTPHPPMYMACTRDEALEIAGSRGLGALVMGFSGPAEVARKNEVYRKAFRERKAEDQVGFAPNEHLAALCPAIVLEDREQARRIGLRGQRFFAECIAHYYGNGPAPSTEDIGADEIVEEIRKDKERFVAFLGQEKIEVEDVHVTNFHVEEDAYGTVDDAIAQVQRLKDAGADEILFLVQMGTIPHEATMETIRNIGKYLIPHFRAANSDVTDAAPMKIAV